MRTVLTLTATIFAFATLMAADEASAQRYPSFGNAPRAFAPSPQMRPPIVGTPTGRQAPAYYSYGRGGSYSRSPFYGGAVPLYGVPY
jgi:hypothetical protein